MQSFSSSSTSLRDLQSECERLTSRRDQLIESFLDHAKTQQLELSDAHIKIAELEKGLIAAQHQTVQIQRLDSSKDRNAYSMTIIDGDCMPFEDELVQSGMNGGMRASHLLQSAMEKTVKPMLSEPAPHLRCHVRVYANVSGLSQTYVRQGIIPNVSVFHDFVRGFNNGHNMCDYVDAGNGKECADEKVKANFHFNIVNLHCRGVIFGGTADNGYARMIGPYVHDEEARRRIILLEGPKPAAEILRFINRFKTLPVYGIFRDQQLPSTSPLSSFPHDTSTSGRQDSDRAWASMAAQKSKTWGNETAVGESDIWNPKPRWDTLGRRQDQQLPQHLVQEMKTVREQKYCNNYHLRGECTMRFCMHKHGQRLTKSLAQCLAAVSRRNPCPQGAYCKDLDCIQGHRCPFENCNRTQCKFPQEMHY